MSGPLLRTAAVLGQIVARKSGCGYRMSSKNVHGSIRLLSYYTQTTGTPSTPSFRLFVGRHLPNGEQELISAWMDIPLYEDDWLNCVIEIPKGTNAKMELEATEDLHPIKQDQKKKEVELLEE